METTEKVKRAETAKEKAKRKAVLIEFSRLSNVLSRLDIDLAYTNNIRKRFVLYNNKLDVLDKLIKITPKVFKDKVSTTETKDVGSLLFSGMTELYKLMKKEVKAEIKLIIAFLPVTQKTVARLVSSVGKTK